MVSRNRIIEALNKYLKVSQFKDYAPIGLQVEGAPKVKKLVTGVSLNMALLEGAVEADAQVVLVHHGMFWKDQSPVLKGPQKQRVAFLLEHDLTLLAYHLPLDAHHTVGNNAQITKILGARIKEGFGEYAGNQIGYVGAYDRAVKMDKILTAAELFSPKPPMHFPGCSDRVKSFAVVSGGAGSLFEQAVDAGVDLYITGEPWEPAQALVQETGVGFLALGHYNSERVGVLALGAWLKRRFKMAVEFIDIPNPA